MYIVLVEGICATPPIFELAPMAWANEPPLPLPFPFPLPTTLPLPLPTTLPLPLPTTLPTTLPLPIGEQQSAPMSLFETGAKLVGFTILIVIFRASQRAWRVT